MASRGPACSAMPVRPVCSIIHDHQAAARMLTPVYCKVNPGAGVALGLYFRSGSGCLVSGPHPAPAGAATQEPVPRPSHPTVPAPHSGAVPASPTCSPGARSGTPGHPPAAQEPGPAPRVTHLQPRNQVQHPSTPTLNCPQDPQVQLQGTCLAQAVLAAHSAVRLDTNSERHSQEA